MKKDHLYIPITASLLWIGFILAISFMEAWLKFQAPGVTIEIGLSIGKLVFNAMIAIAIYVLVAILWFIPNKELEKM